MLGLICLLASDRLSMQCTLHVQALVAQRPVEAFDEGIVRGSSRSRELDADFVVIRPEIDHETGKFAAVVGKSANAKFHNKPYAPQNL
jgi:hypothetical protein